MGLECGRRKSSPKDVYILILGTCDYVSSHGKRDFMWIELSTFMERYLGLSVWVQCNYKGPFGREEGETEKEM